MRLTAPPLLAAAAFTLAACEQSSAPRSSTPPPPAPIRAAPAVPAPPSAESVALARFYGRLEDRLLAEGLMRREASPRDAGIDADMLARNFERIALFSEYVQVRGRYVARQSAAQLRRWERPVRLQLHFGASVDDATRAADTARVRGFVARLRRATGHPISVVGTAGNYHVFVANLDEQAELGPAISAAQPSLSRDVVREITTIDRSTYCAVYASSDASRPDSYVSAIAFIRAEHPDLMRLSCYHEEIAQGLGLANDAREARPSIFNDDEEFALLTRHDELLLRILYDPRLRVGMNADEARPTIRRIAAELLGGAA